VGVIEGVAVSVAGSSVSVGDAVNVAVSEGEAVGRGVVDGGVVEIGAAEGKVLGGDVAVEQALKKAKRARRRTINVYIGCFIWVSPILKKRGMLFVMQQLNIMNNLAEAGRCFD